MNYDLRLRFRPNEHNDPNPSAESWYGRRRRGRQQAELVGPPAPPTLARIADPENLLNVFYDLKESAGQAPGPDGVTYADLSRREACHLMRDLSKAIRAGAYRPGPGRPVRVPKPRGGHRTLTLRDVSFRVVAAALNAAMTTVWESVFVPWSMGFRPRRGVYHLLAEMEFVVEEQDRWVVAIDDVRKAFDFVPIDDVLADHHHPDIRDAALMPLIDVVLRGGDPDKTIGIDQGSAYSPTALNVRLHHAHDRHIERIHESPLCYRYADNLAYLCRSVSEGRQAMHQSQSLLEQSGFTLKGEDGPPTDLRHGGSVQLLGFTLSEKDGKLRYELSGEALQKLKQNLSKAHEAHDPTAAAHNAVNGWIDAYGPAFESRRDDVLDRVLTTAAGYGFREIADREMIQYRSKSSWGRWRYIRMEVRRRMRAGRSEGVG